MVLKRPCNSFESHYFKRRRGQLPWCTTALNKRWYWCTKIFWLKRLNKWTFLKQYSMRKCCWILWQKETLYHNPKCNCVLIERIMDFDWLTVTLTIDCTCFYDLIHDKRGKLDRVKTTCLQKMLGYKSITASNTWDPVCDMTTISNETENFKIF